MLKYMFSSFSDSVSNVYLNKWLGQEFIFYKKIKETWDFASSFQNTPPPPPPPLFNRAS